jgi:Co/Zn/Cd efflux system component
MKQIGSVAVFLSLVCFMFIAGAVEHLQPNPSINDIVSLVGASAIAIAMGLLGLSIINKGE